MERVQGEGWREEGVAVTGKHHLAPIDHTPFELTPDFDKEPPKNTATQEYCCWSGLSVPCFGRVVRFLLLFESTSFSD